MKILQIRFKNLNSLVGEWLIDLTDPAFVSDGIFAITGPTGAGKSTILDAICLALYGQTPRLGKVSKNGNEIMSRQTNECFAEVSFETQAGRYRCHWSQHRAGRKSNGELQQPRHEIAEIDAPGAQGKILESKIRQVAQVIAAATGMDFDRFTRSMLLAQGGFSAFLQASANDRAPILEQITGTEIYSQISRRVHERQRAERDKLKLLEAESSGIVMLKPEDVQALEQEAETTEQQAAKLQASHAETEKAITWLKTLAELEQEIRTLDAEASQLQSEREAFEPERQTLSQALRAASLEGDWATLKALRKQQAEESESLQAETEALPQWEAAATAQGEKLTAAEGHTARVKAELKAAAPIWQKVRALDQRLAEQNKTVAEAEADCLKDALNIEANQEAYSEASQQRITAQEQLTEIENYLTAHAADAWLVSGLAGVEAQLDGLHSSRTDIQQKEAAQAQAEAALAQAKQGLDQAETDYAQHKQAEEEALQALQQEQDALNDLLGGRLLREYRAEKEALLREMALLRDIARLEDYRAKLEDGKPCPLCGAHEHPFAQGNVPAQDETEQKIEQLSEQITQAEAQEAVIQALETAANLARQALTAADKQVSAASHAQVLAEKTLADLSEALKKRQADFNRQQQTVADKLQPLGITEIAEADPDALLAALNERLQAWQAQLELKTATEKQLAAHNSELTRLDALLTMQNAALTEKQERLKALKTELNNTAQERKTLYGEQNPDHEAQCLEQKLTEAESAEQQARALHTEQQQAWQNAKTRIESLSQRLTQREPELKALAAGFAEALLSAGFETEAAFLDASLSVVQRSALEEKAKALDERHTDLKARQKDRQTRLSAETAKQLTDAALDTLTAQHTTEAAALSQLQEAVAGIKHRLREDAAAKERLSEKQAAITAQQKECQRWGTLHELIGSADGQAYRNFAQGLTFEIMVVHANQQLQKMTDRYLLMRDPEQPLNLKVIDNYQAGETRSTQNLPGGESFIVSLALALGLSQMASQNVRVDSLFLDEGFGTLDEDALEIALETLAGLQQEGKLIGIISHVPALKERIATQIVVSPQTAGKSKLSGPGCSKV